MNTKTMTTPSLTISPMAAAETAECAELSVQAFADYEYFTNLFPDEEERLRFMRAMIHSEYRTTRRRAHFLVARHEGTLVAVADLFPPDWKKPSDLQYLLHGWGKVMRLPNQKTIKEWLAMDTMAGHYCHTLLGGTTWYLSSLTVSPKHQGKGFGREMLMDAVVLYVREHGGTRICFFTNSESNLAFYRHLGFEVADYRELDCHGKKMGNWSFERGIE